MSYLHCHGRLQDGTECGWGQDDFWEIDGYNPISFLQKDSDLNNNLFREKMYFDKWFFQDNPSIPHKEDEKGLYCSGRDYIIWELRRKANNIERMLVPTWEEWKEVRDTLKCPRCGGDDWDID